MSTGTDTTVAALAGLAPPVDEAPAVRKPAPAPVPAPAAPPAPPPPPPAGARRGAGRQLGPAGA
ncbi:hypothetical protein ACFWC9_22765, partial [Streptomyces goshikiensis]|uniref:hypothetical protein n=1 Tax=Streptomyces goshikiensis TaxID=1942 RepID=UPI0036A2DCF2